MRFTLTLIERWRAHRCCVLVIIRGGGGGGGCGGGMVHIFTRIYGWCGCCVTQNSHLFSVGEQRPPNGITVELSLRCAMRFSLCAYCVSAEIYIHIHTRGGDT